jgi:hypothetical protein
MTMKPPTRKDPVYGEIPLIEHRSVGTDGREYRWQQYDPAFKPKLPRGAVRGDVSRQEYCVAHHVPKYFYLDETKSCLQCGEPFVFRATEQKYWYETLKFNFGSVAVRCPSCRRKKRTEAALREQLGVVSRQLAERPDDPHLLLELCRITVEYRERTGEGNLERALAASRKAVSQGCETPEPTFWEARCHELAGRTLKAVRCYKQFVESVGSKHGLRSLVTIAKGKLAGEGGAG